MKKRSIFILLVMFVAAFTFGANVQIVKADSPSISYRTHVQNIGWQGWKHDGEMSGTSGKSLRLEGIELKINSNFSGGIKYKTHVQNIGWQDWKNNGEMAGTSGKSLRLEAIQIELTGDVANHYDIYYRVHAQNFGWLDWAQNGQKAGTSDYGYRLEAIEIVLQEKNTWFNNQGNRPYVSAGIKYRTHVQNLGWQNWSYNWQPSGSTGLSYRLEGIEIKLSDLDYSGGVEYQTHVQNIGWQGWKHDGQMSGTSGKSLRLEGIRIKLTGEVAEHYDIYYHTHVQNIGWQEWVKNGEMAGTSGKSLRLESIEIRLEKKYHHLTFDLNGGIVPDGEVASLNRERKYQDGEKSTDPNIHPTKEGYAFVGWSYNDEHYHFNQPVKSDMNFVAEWKKVDKPTELTVNMEDSDNEGYVNYGISFLNNQSSGYEVYYKSNTMSGWNLAEDINNCKLTYCNKLSYSNIHSYRKGRKYSFKVRSYILDYYGEKIYSDFTNEVAVVGLHAPALTSYVDGRAKSVRINTTFSENYASGLEIYRQLGNGSWVLIDELLSSDSNTINYSTSPIDGVINYYKARFYAYDNGEKVYGNYGTSSLDHTYTVIPTFSQVGNQGGKVVFSIDFGQSFDGVKLYYASTIDGEYELLSDITEKVTSNKVNYFSQLSTSGEYYFKAVAYRNYNGTKYYSDYSEVYHWVN